MLGEQAMQTRTTLGTWLTDTQAATAEEPIGRSLSGSGKLRRLVRPALSISLTSCKSANEALHPVVLRL